MCDADGRATTGPVYCAGVSQCFDDIGINHPPMNSGVISLNSPWLPLHREFYHEIGNIEKCLFTYWLNGGDGFSKSWIYM